MFRTLLYSTGCPDYWIPVDLLTDFVTDYFRVMPSSKEKIRIKRMSHKEHFEYMSNLKEEEEAF